MMNKSNGLNGKVRKYPIVTTWVAGIAILIPILLFGFKFSNNLGAAEERVNNNAQQIEEIKKTQETVVGLQIQQGVVMNDISTIKGDMKDNKRLLRDILDRLPRERRED